MKTCTEVRAVGGRVRGWRAVALACVLTSALLMGASDSAAAATFEMRGEWNLYVTVGGKTVKGAGLITEEPNANGEFAASSYLIEGSIPGTFSGKINGLTASVKLSNEATGGFPATEFNSSSMTITATATSLSMSGQGTIVVSGTSAPATLTATRVKTLKEVEEQKAREKREQEEREAREKVRGEWSLVLQVGPQTINGTARVSSEANATNEFASSSALFEGTLSGQFSGTLEGSKATVTITTQETGPMLATTFTSSSMSVSSSASTMSMSGSGTFTSSGLTLPATLTATRIKDYAQLSEIEAAERLQREASEALERETQERLQREAKERLERETREALEAASKTSTTVAPASQSASSATIAVSVQPSATTLTVGASGTLTLKLANPNTFAVQGRLTLLGQIPRARTARRRSHGAKLLLGRSSFTIAADGQATVKIVLTRAARAALARYRTLRAIAKLLTQASGKTSTVKTYPLTLRASRPARRRR